MARQSSGLSKRIPFIDEEDDEFPAKRVFSDAKAQEAARAKEAERSLTSAEAALTDIYRCTNRDWINKYWHSTLVNIDVAIKYSMKYVENRRRLTVALENAVKSECELMNAEINSLISSEPPESRAKTAEPVVVVSRNFVFRTQQRLQAVSMLDSSYFRVVHKQSMLEFVSSIFSKSVSTHDSSFTLATLLLESCREDFAEGCVWTSAFLMIYNEPGMGHPRATPWQTISDELWEREIDSNREIVAKATSQNELSKMYADPKWLVSNINGWVLNISHSASFCLKYTNSIRMHSKKSNLDSQEKPWLDRLAQTISEPFESWAKYAIVASNDPILTSHTAGMSQEFFSDGRHSIWTEKQWPQLFEAVNTEIAGLYPNSVTRSDVAWRVLQCLKNGIASTQQAAFKEAYFKAVYDQIGYRFCADSYELSLKYKVGSKSTTSNTDSLFVEVGKVSLESLEQSYFDEAVLGSQSHIVRAFEDRLNPLPAGLARSVLSAILFAYRLDSFDSGRFENESYMAIARLHSPQPIGHGIKSLPTVTEIFNDITKDQYHHAMVMVTEIENQVQNSSRKMISSNSGNWMSSVDPFLVPDVRPEILRSIVPSLVDSQAEKPAVTASNRPDGGEKIYKWHPNWSAVKCELGDAHFSCSWSQLEFLQTLLSSAKPSREHELLKDPMPDAFAVQCVQDFAANSNGFVKQAEVDGHTYYAIDSNTVPTGNWMRLEFADEW